MNKLLLQRLCAAILVLSFVVGLPMQGIAMTSQMAMTATSGIPMTDGRDTCGDDPAMNACPVVFCIGLTAVVLEKQESKQPSSETAWTDIPDAEAGLSRRPDPYPPRTSFLS